MFTPDQQRAILANGNTLVAAGAGAGKTRTLVERSMSLLFREENPVSIRDLLVVTFTEAAAAEVRERIRKRLQEAADANPANEWLSEQIAYLDAAHISTLHSFCFALVREHFYELDIDPAVSVMDETEGQILFASTLDDLMEEHYQGKHPFSAELLEFIRENLNGWDKGLREFIRAIHHYTQTRPNASGWFEAQARLAETEKAARWEDWHREAVSNWCGWWLPFLRSLPEVNVNAHKCADLIAAACAAGDLTVAQDILARDDIACWPKGKKGAHRKTFEKLFEEAKFLASLKDPDALQQDWDWSRGPLKLMIALARQFADRFTEAKRERSRVDFHDLEQLALTLLWNETEQGPTQIAHAWQSRFKALFVDEYQDINAAQDRIIRALSSEVPPGNRFLVGDIKQSIYRFRQADPSIFRSYFESGSEWEQVWLSDNFRSHAAILDFINPLFGWMMRRDLGGVDYDERAALRFGESPSREAMKSPAQAPAVELHLRFKPDKNEAEAGEDDAGANIAEIEDAEHEARLVASRLREMHQSGLTIYDQEERTWRKVKWSDMVVLLRSAASKVEIYAKAFAALGVPLVTKRDAFYSTQEVLDLCCLLHILDNPLQDIPLVAVLRSPLVGLTANELAAVRIASDKKPFWRALNQFLENKKESTARAKIEPFLDKYHRWRTSRANSSLAGRVEAILADTGYGEWLLSQPRGQQRYANVQQLLRIARQFDESRGESLYLFLRHIEELQEAAGDLKPAAIGCEDAVSLMTVHQSKGLEFHIVAVADLGKRFNHSDLQSALLLDEKYGICTMIKPPDVRRRYPSLPLWLARRTQRQESAGEEMRVLYVALTRAQNHLLLFGTTTQIRASENWRANAFESPSAQTILKASSALDWIGSFATVKAPFWTDHPEGIAAGFSYWIHTGPAAAPAENQDTALPEAVTEQILADVIERVSFTYEHSAALSQAAKTSVTSLRRRAFEDDESAVFVSGARTHGDGAERGLAMHAFLEYLPLEGSFDPLSLKKKAETLVSNGLIRPDHLPLIDFEGVSAFWTSDTGRELLANSKHLRREFPITCRLTADDLSEAGLPKKIEIPPGEFLVLQGVADLLMLGPAEIWLLDFKTDAIRSADVHSAVERYLPQLALYGVALSAIYKRPVTRKGIFFISPREFVWA